MNILSLMKNAKKMQEAMKQNQKEMAEKQFVAEAGAGAVKITFSYNHYAHKVEIDPEMLSDKEVLEDLIAACINSASETIAKTNQDMMSSMGADMGMGDLGDLLGGGDK